MIYKLIIQELVPKTASGFCGRTHSYEAIRTRLNQNVTYIAGQVFSPIQGFISIQPRGYVLFIDMLAVQPKERGRGVGKLLMRTAEQCGLQLNCIEAQLFVDDTNFKGISFYQALGYRPAQFVAQLRCYLMQKRF